MGDVRGLFREELARHVAPALGDLVHESMAQGRRLRRRRRLAQLGAAGSALTLLLAIGLVGGPLRPGAYEAGQLAGPTIGSPSAPVDTATSSPAEAPGGGLGRGADEERAASEPQPEVTTTVIDTVRIGAGPKGEMLTTTPQGALELLTRLLPKGETSGYASLESSGTGRGMPFVQLYLDRGEGPGMLRLSVYQDHLGDDPVPGTVELTEVPDNCVQDKMVTVHHRDGLQVDLLISTCLAWNGKESAAAPPALSVQEATVIAANPVWGTKLPAEYVQNGAKRFPTLARSNG